MAFPFSTSLVSPALPTGVLSEAVTSYMRTCIPEGPASLYLPVLETIGAGGKRVRPILTALCAQLFIENSPDSRERPPFDAALISPPWLPAACAVELLHTFTLVHDDIMDHAPSRRGIPTVHVAHGINTAILSGDVLMAIAMETLSRSPGGALPAMMTEFGAAFRMVCEGQALDKEFETRDDITVAEYLRMIDLKTSKILELAAVLGVLSTGGAQVEIVRTFAHYLGLAFQISDDLLDLTAEEATFGKTIGGDIVEGKRTLLFVLATNHYPSLDDSERYLMDKVRNHIATARDISPARALFERIGVLDAASTLAAQQTKEAAAALRQLPPSPARDALESFSSALLQRSS